MPARKRQAPETPESARRSLRVSSSSKKVKYAEDDSDEDLDEGNHVSVKKARAGKPRGKATGRKTREVEDDEDDYVNDDEDEEDVESDGEGNDVADKDEDNEEREVEEDDDDDDDGVPKVTVVRLPKLRDTGGVDYEDDKLHKNTMLFLKDLKANNKRAWLTAHDAEYRRSWKDWQTFVESLTQKLIEVDDTIPELPVKDLIFRIYRDVRFSKDQTPYKAHYSAAWSRTGRKGPYAHYYIHCEPGNSFIGGGIWQPDANSLQKLRASIDERPRRWYRVLMDETFRRTFLPKAKANEKSVRHEFAGGNAEGALKTKPKGFIADHRDIELLKLRSFTVRKQVPDSAFTADDGQDQLAAIVGAMVAFITHLNSVVMPDAGIDVDSDEE